MRAHRLPLIAATLVLACAQWSLCLQSYQTSDYSYGEPPQTNGWASGWTNGYRTDGYSYQDSYQVHPYQQPSGWSAGYDDPQPPKYIHKFRPNARLIEAAEVLLLGPMSGIGSRKSGNETIRGVVQIYQWGDEYIDIKGIICNLKPNSRHGLHVHKYGEIHPTCTSTLGHFNPYGQHHGPHKNDRIIDRHLGDLGNIQANESGVATFRLKDYNLRIDDNRIFSILGRSLVLHAREDDLGNDRAREKTSHHNGNAGVPIACGVVGLADPSLFNSKPLRCTAPFFSPPAPPAPAAIKRP